MPKTVILKAAHLLNSCYLTSRRCPAVQQARPRAVPAAIGANRLDTKSRGMRFVFAVFVCYHILCIKRWGFSSAGERTVHIREATGSSPVTPTTSFLCHVSAFQVSTPIPSRHGPLSRPDRPAWLQSAFRSLMRRIVRGEPSSHVQVTLPSGLNPTFS